MNSQTDSDRRDNAVLLGALAYMVAAIMTAAWLAGAKYSFWSSVLLALVWPLVAISFYGE